MKILGFQWHLTNRCNLRCNHCYQSQFQDLLPEEIIFQVAAKLLMELKERNYHATLNLTGGEPFLLGNTLFSLLDFLNASEVVQELTIITNALLIDEKDIQKLGTYEKFTTLKVSLEGARAVTNDAIRGKGTFEKVIQKLTRWREKGLFEIILMFTVSKKNLAEVEEMFSLTQNLHFDGLMIERFIPEGRGKEMSEAVLGPRDWKELIQRLVVLSDIDADPLKLAPYKAFLVKFDKEIELWGAPCNLKEAFCLMPDGTVFPCRRFLYPLGNILEVNLFEIIEGSVLLQKVAEKNSLQGKCKTCSISNCFGCRALGYALFRDPFAEDIQCFVPS
ncbi:MAG: radical SAM protein [Candidatus Caldatribacteriaceae bacterium]